MPYPRSVNISEILDFSPISRLQIEILCLCILVTFIDGFDVQAIAYSAPAIIHNWHITRSAFTPALVAGVSGTVVGTLLLGPLADYVGRKWIIIGCTAFVSLCSFATMAAHSIETITILRFVTGLGIGGAYPNAIALTSEYSSRKHQTLMVVIAVCGNSLGGVIGGTLAARLIPEFGWPSVFMFGGLLPLILIPVLVWKLCESVRFLIIKQRAPDQVIKILKRMKLDSHIPEGARFVLTEETRSGVSLKHLFTDGRARMTLLIWTMWFMNLTGMFFISSWLPTVANAAGLSISRAVMAGSLLHAGGIIGCLCFGLIVRRMNSTTALGVFYLLGTFCIVALGAVTAAPNLVLIAAFAAGFCVIGSQNSSNAVTARLYPTFIGATGISWAFGIGRMGSIAGPLIGGGLLSLNLSTQNLFLIAAIPGLIAAIAAFTLAASTFGNYRVSPVEQRAVGMTAPDSK
jgi:AAHS family 4-hydroxybenzoate transporter-like MFS transporter